MTRATPTPLSVDRREIVGRDALIAAYQAGAGDVHKHWANADEVERTCLGRDEHPDFVEAAHDYADATHLPPPPPTVGAYLDWLDAGKGCQTERGDTIAAEMRAHYEAHKKSRWQEGNADNLMLGLLNIAWKHIAPRTNQERIDTLPGFAERLTYERRILALECALEEARRWTQAAMEDRDTGTQPGNACFNALQVIDAALIEQDAASPPQGEAVERVKINARAAHKWLSDGQQPRRTEVERTLCMNKALAHLDNVLAALSNDRSTRG